MQKVRNFFNKFIEDESGQGMTEYALLLMVIVGIAFAFKKPILDMVTAKMGEISGKVGSFDEK